jgi:hypothetical protein
MHYDGYHFVPMQALCNNEKVICLIQQHWQCNIFATKKIYKENLLLIDILSFAHSQN